MEEEAIGDDDAEVTVNKVEEEMIVCIIRTTRFYIIVRAFPGTKYE
jgi:hypothetical protein